jgi:hypothetical protein
MIKVAHFCKLPAIFFHFARMTQNGIRVSAARSSRKSTWIRGYSVQRGIRSAWPALCVRADRVTGHIGKETFIEEGSCLI